MESTSTSGDHERAGARGSTVSLKWGLMRRVTSAGPHSAQPSAWLQTLPVAALTAAALVLVVNSVDYIPTNDGPEAVFAAHVVNGYAQSQLFQWHFELLPQYAYRGFSTLLLPLQAWLPWKLALRVALSVLVTGSALAGWALLGALHPRRRWLVPVLGGTVLSWTFFMGFFAYVVGVALGTGVIALAVASRPLTPARRAWLALGLFVLSVSHVFAASLTGLVVALVLVARASTLEERAREALLTLLMGIPALSVATLTVLEAQGWNHEQGEVRFLSPSELATELPRFVLPGTGFFGWLCLATCVGSIALACLRWRRGELGREERGLLMAAVPMLLASALAPFHLPAWQCFSPRFLPFAVTLSLALLPVERLSLRAARGAAVAAAVGGFASVWASAGVVRRLHEGCAPSLAVLSAALEPWDGVLLPLPFDGHCGVARNPTESEVPYLSPLLHLGPLLATVHGGSTAYALQGWQSLHLIGVRKAAKKALPAPHPEHSFDRFVSPTGIAEESERRALYGALLPFGTRYQRVALVGAPETDAPIWRDAGFETEWRSGSVEIVRFQGCPVTIHVPADRQLAVLALGIQGMDAPLFEVPMAPPPDAPPGPVPITTRLERQWCGPLWLRVWWDRDGSGSLTPGDAVCDRGDADGRVEFVPTREGATVRCSPKELRAQP
jgi:hypothetical protein